MAKLDVKNFSEWLKQQVGSVYCWGAQGETLYGITRELAKRKDQSDKNTSKMLTYMEQLGIKDISFYDCSGLGVSYLMANNALNRDCTASMLYDKCAPIKSTEVTEGCWGFLKDSNGNIYHVGYVVDNDMIIHAFNQQKGVICENRILRKWIYARPEFAFKFETPQKPYYEKLNAGDKVIITEDIKGYNTADNALKEKNLAVIYPSGEYYVYRKYNGSINITKKKGVPGAWVVL